MAEETDIQTGENKAAALHPACSELWVWRIEYIRWDADRSKADLFRETIAAADIVAVWIHLRAERDDENVDLVCIDRGEPLLRIIPNVPDQATASTL